MADATGPGRHERCVFETSDDLTGANFDLAPDPIRVGATPVGFVAARQLEAHCLVAIVLGTQDRQTLALGPKHQARPTIVVQVGRGNANERARNRRAERAREIDKAVRPVVMQERQGAVGGQSNHVRPAIRVDIDADCVPQGGRIRRGLVEPRVHAALAVTGFAESYLWRLVVWRQQNVGARVVVDVENCCTIPGAGRGWESFELSKAEETIVLDCEWRLTIAEENKVHILVPVEIGEQQAGDRALGREALRPFVRGKRKP